MEQWSNFLRDNHVVQFLITILIITFYFISFQSGHSSQLLETGAITAIAFFFANTSTSAISYQNSNKLDQIKTKLDTQEVKAQQLKDETKV